MQAKERTVVLNEAQQQVVNELDRNIVLLASAGTGKTNTLSYRVAHIIQSERAKAEEILCLTSCESLNISQLLLYHFERRSEVTRRFISRIFDY